MTDDLVKRLRKRQEFEFIDGHKRVEWEDEDALDAADRIEKLEKALKFYAKATPDYLHGADWDWDCGEKRYGVVAREALEDK